MPGLRPKDRARLAVERLAAIYPAASELQHRNAFQMLIATILSAQTTDRSVNSVTPALFARYPDAAALAHADPQAVEALIKPTGFFHVKAKTIVACSAALVERFGGEVPPRMEDLVTLPGVGRKTANVVLGVAFGIPGFAVDTHVTRLTRRLGLTRSTDPVKIESDVTKLIPASEWTGLGGRRRDNSCPSRRTRPGSRAASRIRRHRRYVGTYGCRARTRPQSGRTRPSRHGAFLTSRRWL